MSYEVQMYTSHRTWKNACAYDEGDGVIREETFATRAEAEAALDELLADIAADMAHGFCPPWRLEDFRVECVAARLPHTGDHRAGADGSP
jgi:hypothetical protein